MKKETNKIKIGIREEAWLRAARYSPNNKIFVKTTTHGVPPATVRNLVRKGLFWVQKYQTLYWMPQNKNGVFHYQPHRIGVD